MNDSPVMTSGRQLVLQRLSYLVRHYVSGNLLDMAKGASLEVAAEMIGGRLVWYLKVQVFGQQKTRIVEIEAPDGRWQCLRAALGLRYRKRRIRFDAFQLFPDFVSAVTIPSLGRVLVTLEHSEPKTDDEDSCGDVGSRG